MVIIFLLNLVGLFLVLTSCLSFFVLMFRICFLYHCKFVCFACDKNLGVFLILCFMFVSIFFFDGFSFFAIKIFVF